jgi:hypothetical protein
MTDPSREMRISDSDRQSAADRLQAALNEGRLPVAEYDNRLGRLYQAVTYGDVAALFADLPNQQPVMQAAMPQMPPMPMPMPMPPPQQTVGPMTGPGAVVQNTIVVNPGVAVAPSSGLATAALVFGILGLICFWVPFGDVLFAALAVLFAILGMGQTRGGAYAGHGKAVAGLVMGIIGLIPAIIVISLLLTAAAFI